MEFRQIRQAGFTLVEIMSVVAIAGVLISSAVPSFQSLIERNQLTASANLFLSHIHQARSEAIKRESFVTLCPSSDGQRCFADFTRWAKGYIVFEDKNKSQQRDAGEALISHYQGKKSALKIYSSSNYRNAVAYNPNGRAWGFNTTIRFCARINADHNRALIIASTGRPRISKRMPDGHKIMCD